MKSFFSSADTLKNQNLGLAMIAASLLVIVFIRAYLFNYQRNTQLSQIRSQGVALVRLLGSFYRWAYQKQHGRFGGRCAGSRLGADPGQTVFQQFKEQQQC
jgi:hypothetical protein